MEPQDEFDEVLATLPPLEESIIRRRFGIDCPEMKMNDIAKDLNINRNTAYRRFKRGMYKLHHHRRLKILRKLYYERNAGGV